MAHSDRSKSFRLILHKTMKPRQPARQRKAKAIAERQPDVYYVYHWNRILAVMALLALLFGLAGFAFVSWWSSVHAPAPAVTLPVPDARTDRIAATETEMPRVSPATPESAGGVEATTPLVVEIPPVPLAPDYDEPAPAAIEAEALPSPAEFFESATITPFDDVSPDSPATAVTPDVESQARIEPVVPDEMDTPMPTESAIPHDDDNEASMEAVSSHEEDARLPIESEMPFAEPTPATVTSDEPPETASSHVFLPPDTRVNLRAAPSLSSPVLRILDDRAELQLLGTTEAFFQVRTAERITGWVSREYSSLLPYTVPTYPEEAD